jgi:hypothetical protein
MRQPNKLPRRLSFGGGVDLATLSRLVGEAFDDVIEYVRQLPRFEFKTFSTAAVDFPLFVSTELSQPLGCFTVHTYETKSGAILQNANIGWAKSDDPSRPGIKITSFSGMSAGTEYTVVVLLVGKGG